MEFKENQGENHMPSFVDVSTAYADVISHNRENTGLAGRIKATIQAMLSNPELIDDKSSGTNSDNFNEALDEQIEQSIIEGEMSAELQGILHSETFMRIGIEIAPLGGYVKDQDGKKTSSEELLPIVRNTQLFKEFMTTIDPEQISLDEKQLPQAVLESLSTTLNALLNPKDLDKLPDELKENIELYTEDIIRTFIELETEYERLGLDAHSLREEFHTDPGPTSRIVINERGIRQSAPIHTDPEEQKVLVDKYNRYYVAQKLAKTYDELVGFVTHWGMNVLPEYAIANSKEYLTEPENQGFGPAKWHYDGAQYRWSEALDFLEELGKEERTLEFREKVRAALVRSLDTAIAESENSHREDLINVRSALTFELFDQQKLEAYLKKPDYTS